MLRTRVFHWLGNTSCTCIYLLRVCYIYSLVVVMHDIRGRCLYKPVTKCWNKKSEQESFEVNTCFIFAVAREIPSWTLQGHNVNLRKVDTYCYLCGELVNVTAFTSKKTDEKPSFGDDLNLAMCKRRWWDDMEKWNEHSGCESHRSATCWVGSPSSQRS